jgi:hypothetical protein
LGFGSTRCRLAAGSPAPVSAITTTRKVEEELDCDGERRGQAFLFGGLPGVCA